MYKIKNIYDKSTLKRLRKLEKSTLWIERLKRLKD